MPAAQEGAGGRLQEAGCHVGPTDLYLNAKTTIGLSSTAQANYNDFNKKTYRHGPAVLTKFCGQHNI